MTRGGAEGTPAISACQLERACTGALLVASLLIASAAAQESGHPVVGRRLSTSADSSALNRLPIGRQSSKARAATGGMLESSASRVVAGSNADQAVSLSRPSQREVPERRGSQATTPAITTVIGSLAVVICLFFGLVWTTRRVSPRGMATLPGEVVESLGRAPLAARQQMQLIRLGNRLLLLSVTAQGAETLAEITDRAEVDRLAGLCQQQRPGSVSGTFRQVLTQFGTEPVPSGFVGNRASGSRSRAG